jgi:hypothetical protein
VGRGGSVGNVRFVARQRRPWFIRCFGAAARVADAPTNKPVAVLQNRHETGHHWLGVHLVGRPYRDAIGARLELQLKDGVKSVRAA